MKNSILLTKVFIAALLIALVTIFFTAFTEPIEEPLNPYVIGTLHNVLFFGFGISFFYTIYLAGCVYLHYLRDLERAKMVNKVKDESITPEVIYELEKILDFGLLTVVLYVIQSYVYGYTFI